MSLPSFVGKLADCLCQTRTLFGRSGYHRPKIHTSGQRSVRHLMLGLWQKRHGCAIRFASMWRDDGNLDDFEEVPGPPHFESGRG